MERPMIVKAAALFLVIAAAVRQGAIMTGSG